MKEKNQVVFLIVDFKTMKKLISFLIILPVLIWLIPIAYVMYFIGIIFNLEDEELIK